MTIRGAPEFGCRVSRAFSAAFWARRKLNFIAYVLTGLLTRRSCLPAVGVIRFFAVSDCNFRPTQQSCKESKLP